MWTFGRKIAAGFALAFLMLTVIGAVAYRSINSLTETSRLVTHTHEVLENIATLIGLLKDAETGTRGYIITGEEPFLDPYKSSITVIPTVMEKLRALTADNPHQQRRLDSAAPLIRAKLANSQAAIDLRRKGDLAQVTRIVSAGTGKKIMDELRGISAQMEQARITGPKIVEDELNSKRFEANHGEFGGIGIANERRLGDFEFKPCRIEISF